MYNYATEGNMLEKDRSANLEFLQNVNFLEMNSLNLINYNQEFDLIWIDGEHTYPTVAVDIANSVRLLSANGVAICDDVYIETEEGFGSSVASLQTLEALSYSKLIKYTLLHKRIGGYFNYPKSNKKYLGYFMKF